MSEGLRIRKKRRTWRAIQDAALELVEARGYEATTVGEIAARAEVSVTTFFRYFASKDEVIFPGRHDRLPVLHRALREQPASAPDLEAVRDALREALQAVDDPARVARQVRVVGTSPVLRGRAAEVMQEWQTAVTDALAERRGLASPDHACHLTAAVAMTAFGRAISSWAADGGDGDDDGDVHARIDETFALLAALAAEWAAPT